MQRFKPYGRRPWPKVIKFDAMPTRCHAMQYTERHCVSSYIVHNVIKAIQALLQGRPQLPLVTDCWKHSHYQTKLQSGGQPCHILSRALISYALGLKLRSPFGTLFANPYAFAGIQRSHGARAMHQLQVGECPPFPLRLKAKRRFLGIGIPPLAQVGSGQERTPWHLVTPLHSHLNKA